jgi:hypothetical protein
LRTLNERRAELMQEIESAETQWLDAGAALEAASAG